MCQKKNHFQVTAHVEMHGRPKFVKTPEGQVQPIDAYYLHFYGIKVSLCPFLGYTCSGVTSR